MNNVSLSFIPYFSLLSQHRDTEDNTPETYFDFTPENYKRVRTYFLCIFDLFLILLTHETPLICQGKLPVLSCLLLIDWFSGVIFLRHPSSKNFVLSNERQIKQLHFFILGIAEKLMFLSSDIDFNDKVHRFTDK